MQINVAPYDEIVHRIYDAPLHQERCSGVFAMVYDLATQWRHDPFVAAALHSLAPAESALVVAVAAGAALREIAQRNGVAVATARSQLHAVFAQMDLSRQAEVVLALAQLPALGVQGRGGVERMAPLRQ